MTSSTSASRPNRSTTVMIVEDEPMLLDLLGRELEDFGYVVLSAMTSEDALRLLSETATRIDLLVTDIRLPGSINGWDIAERARDARPDIQVIYVTGFNDEARRDVAGSVFILKPYRPSMIVKAARRLGVS